MEVIISNNSGIALDVGFFQELAENILSFEKIGTDAELSVVLVDKDEIQNLNAKYRRINTPTDVLSFPQSQDDFEGPCLLGDVVISPQVAEDQAVKYQHSFEKEMVILLIHGILHLIGFDHEESEEKEEMQKREEEILNRLVREKRVR